MPRVADSLVSLLESGADREPDIVEQVKAMVFVKPLSCYYQFSFFFFVHIFFNVANLKFAVFHLQIFTSWSFIMMYLQKYLIRDIITVLK